MTQSGSPYDNALAERVNGTIKNDFFPRMVYKNHEEAEKSVSSKIKIYNDIRPHDSLDYLTPSVAHEKSGPLRKKWKTYKKQKEVSMTETQ
jgi:transposase InsO family protein